MAQMRSPEWVQERLCTLLAAEADIKVFHLVNAAGYEVRIGEISMVIPYARVPTVDPLVEAGWKCEMVGEGADRPFWSKGTLAVWLRDPNESYPWSFSSQRREGEAFVVEGYTGSREEAVACAEALAALKGKLT